MSHYLQLKHKIKLTILMAESFWLPSSSHLTAVVQCTGNPFPWSHTMMTVKVEVHTYSSFLLCCCKMSTYHCNHWLWNTQPLPHFHETVSWDQFHHLDEVVNCLTGICEQNNVHYFSTLLVHMTMHYYMMSQYTVHVNLEGGTVGFPTTGLLPSPPKNCHV